MTISIPKWYCLPILLLCAAPARAQVSEVALERQLARDLGVTVGDTFRLGPTPDSVTSLARVVAVYEPKPDPAEIAKRERHIRMHLPELAALLGIPDRVDRLSIGLNPG